SFPDHGGEAAFALPGRRGGRLDDLCSLLSGRAVDGLRVRASAIADQRHQKADACAPGCAVAPFSVSSHSVRYGFDPVAVVSSLCPVAADVDDVDGCSVFCYFVDGASRPEMVLPEPARSFTGSLLSVLRKQCRQSAGAALVSFHHRTTHGCCGSNKAVGSGISHTLHAARRDCGGALSAPAGVPRSASAREA